MLISFHLPKTAGTAFRLFMERNAGSAAAFDYVGTPSGTLAPARALLSSGAEREAVADAVRAAGVEMIHGHAALDFLEVFPEAPAMMFVREPLACAVSDFLGYKRARDPHNPVAREVMEGRRSIEAYLRSRRDLVTRYADRLAAGGRPTALFVSERTSLAAQVFREALGWRGTITRRNLRPIAEDGVAQGLIDEWAPRREELLGADCELYYRLDAAWSSGEAGAAAARIIACGPSPRRAKLAQRTRRTLGLAREHVGRFLAQYWA